MKCQKYSSLVRNRWIGTQWEVNKYTEHSNRYEHLLFLNNNTHLTVVTIGIKLMTSGPITVALESKYTPEGLLQYFG